MTRRSVDTGRYTQADFIRVGFIAAVWAMFYAVMVAQPTPDRLSRGASAPDWRAAAADFARLPDPPAPARDAFAR
jgi:hypothetical protein